MIRNWNAERSERASRSRPAISRGRVWLAVFAAALVWALWQAGVLGGALVNEGGWVLVRRFFAAALQPVVEGSFLALVLRASLTTLAYAVAGTFVSVFIGCLGAVVSSEMWWEAVLGGGRGRRRAGAPWLLVRGLLAVPRGIHELLWGLFFVNIFGLDPLSAILAIAVPYGAITAKVFAEMLDEAPREPYDALLNSGVGPLRAMLYSTIPQTLPDLLSYTFYRFECSIRAAAVLGVIGAGGLGYQILLSLQSLRYNELWTLFYALMALSGLADVWSSLLRRRLARGPEVSGWEAGARQQEEGAPPLTPASNGRERSLVVRASLWLALLLVPFSFWYVAPDVGKLWSPRTASLLGDVVAQSWPLRLEAAFLRELVTLSGQTLAMSLLAATIAAVGGMLFAFPAANNFILPGGLLDRGRSQGPGALGRYILWGATRLLLLLLRAIPAPIWALVLLFVFFPGILPGALALAFYNLGILGRLMAEVVENQNPLPLRALQTTGASGGQIFLYGSLPLALPRFLAYALYRWEIAIRATVIVGLVGAGGLGRVLTEQLSRFDYRSVGVTLLFYMALTFVVDMVSAAVRR